MAHGKVVTSFGSALLGGALFEGALLLYLEVLYLGESTWGCTTSDNLASSQHKLWLYYSGYNSPDM